MDKVIWLEDLSDENRRTMSGQHFRIGDTNYIATMSPKPVAAHLCIVKPPNLVDETVALARKFRGANIVELGVRHGGSTALLTQIAQPAKLVTIELSEKPLTALEAFLDVGDRRDHVHPYFGVDQSDRERVARILDDEFGDEPIDLVIDDASHLPDETRASFEVVFPRIRAGGLFVLEDWNCDHVRARGVHDAVNNPDSPGRKMFEQQLKERLADPSSTEFALFQKWLQEKAEHPDRTSVPSTDIRPLTLFVLELVVARAWSGDVIDEVTLKDAWTVVRRGPATLDPTTFRMADIVHDRFHLLPESTRST
jgi:predicted O-methyltransferase YrrM